MLLVLALVSVSVAVWSLGIPTNAANLFVVLYGYALAYLVAPETFSSANVIEIVAGLPDVVKYAGKTILAAPFAFHSLNGLRHLSWDMGKCQYPDFSSNAGYILMGRV